MADRLRNDAAMLRFLAENTTILVPKCLRLWTENGLVHLKTAILDAGVELNHVEKSRLSAAVVEVTAQLESDILPQLHSLRRDTLESPDPNLPVIPPRRVWDSKGTRVFPSTIEGVDQYVLCHTDLDRQNILVDPNTYRIVGILDWETAGFFPKEWELPLWKANTREESYGMRKAVQKRDLAMLGFEEQD